MKSRRIQLAIKLFQGTFLEKSLHLQDAQKLSDSIYGTVTPNLFKHKTLVRVEKSQKKVHSWLSSSLGKKSVASSDMSWYFQR